MKLIYSYEKILFVYKNIILNKNKIVKKYDNFDYFINNINKFTCYLKIFKYNF